MTTSQNHSTVFDEHVLARLMIEFAAAADDADSVDAVTELFDVDGVFTVGGESHRGRAAIARYLQRARDAGFAGPAAGTRHVVTNSLVSIESDAEANGRSGWMLVRSSEVDGVAPAVLATGRYEDRYRRVAGVWRIATRVVLP